MHIGILNAIHPEGSRVNWQGTPVDAYIRFFQSVNAPFTYTGYAVTQGKLPDSVDACDAYVITGSPKGVYDSDLWIAELAQFIRDSYQAKKKLVGICFGHQILAHALGGHAEKSEKGKSFGYKQFDIYGEKSWMTTKPDTCGLYFAHQDQVVKLPPGAERLAGNAFCENMMYTIDNRALGIQGHPEFTNEIMQDLLPGVEKDAPGEFYETAVSSLKNSSPDNQLMGEWIVNFLSL
ncbi:MAG: GMP synthase [Chloroflexi bacterium]|nr:GMP synthase [Chloroflexota bacterium]